MALAEALPVILPRLIPKSLSPRNRAGEPGFSILELLVVVIIISVLAVVAIPSIVNQLRDRRTHELSERVMLTYREARMRAMGRGSAVLMRFDRRTIATGTLEMREGVEGATRVAERGAAAGCAPLPTAGCTTNSWSASADDNRSLSFTNPATRGEYLGMRVAMDAGVANRNFVDICFSPLGGAFVRYADNQPFARLTIVPTLRVWRENSGGTRIGLERSIVILPNGVSRLAL